MIVFSYGMPKSGSTFGYQLICEVLKQNGHDQAPVVHPALKPDAGLNFAGVLDAAAFSDLDGTLGRDGMLAIKTHQPPADWVRSWIDTGRAAGFASFRDPRDMALSLLDAGRQARRRGFKAFSDLSTIDDVRHRLPARIKDFENWSAIPGVRPLAYDAVAFDTAATLEAIAAHLGLPVRTWPVVAKFASGRAIGQFNRGVRNRHRREMDADEAAWFERSFAEFLAFCREHGEGLPVKATVLARVQNMMRRVVTVRRR